MKRVLPVALTALLCLTLLACGGDNSSGTTNTTPPPTAPPPTPAPTPTPTPTPAQPNVALTPAITGLNNPLDLQAANDGTGRLFILEKAGVIRVAQAGANTATTFLDIRSKIANGEEMGLLGLAFHPSYSTNRRFFIHYNRSAGGQLQSVIAEYAASATDPNQADPASERDLLILPVNKEEHKGGQMAFGTDNMLYFTFGDDDPGGDPAGNGQNVQVLKGKVLRIDVNSQTPGKQYGIPPDNPFAAGGGQPEIWAFGFRNPWRFSFDRPTGRLFVADVGEAAFEEIDIVQRGGNYGWNIMEASHCFKPASGCNENGLQLPITEYPHSEGNAVIGGYVYHGAAIPALQNAYVFGDFGKGTVWFLRESPPGTFTRSVLLDTGKGLSSFGQDEAGELYFVAFFEGTVYKIVPKS